MMKYNTCLLSSSNSGSNKEIGWLSSCCCHFVADAIEHESSIYNANTCQNICGDTRTMKRKTLPESAVIGMISIVSAIATLSMLRRHADTKYAQLCG